MKGKIVLLNGKLTLIVEDDDEYSNYLFEPGETTGTATRRSDDAIVKVSVSDWRPIETKQ